MDESSKSKRGEMREFWEEAIRLWAESHLSVREFCDREGLAKHAFYSWRRELMPVPEVNQGSPATGGEAPSDGRRRRRQKRAVVSADINTSAVEFLPVRVVSEEVSHAHTASVEPAEQNVVVAAKPPEAIPGALAGPGLMAQAIVSKGADHLPLHRLEGIFKRQALRDRERSARAAADGVARTAVRGASGVRCRRAPIAITAVAGGIPRVAGDGVAEGLAQKRRPRRDGLHAEQLDRVVSLHRIGLVRHRQQRRRKCCARHRAGTQELARLWKRPRRPRGGDPFQPVDVLQAS